MRLISTKQGVLSMTTMFMLLLHRSRSLIVLRKERVLATVSSLCQIQEFNNLRSKLNYVHGCFCARQHTRSQHTSLHARRRGQSGMSKDSFDDNDESVNTSSVVVSNNKQPDRRERMELILQRDGLDCVWCRTPLNLETATTDHLIPRLKGGPSWIENEVAACRRCNKTRGHTKPLDWLTHCVEFKGWNSNKDAINNGLRALDEAIAMRGGQRKARVLLEKQLKQLGKH